ncbi:MAG: tetratricopeptide repeat protein [Cyclobacteriaceae bacterium]|nr:tetratricopeptide repeat protein [Cyclobacteriaceae bacterium]
MFRACFIILITALPLSGIAQSAKTALQYFEKGELALQNRDYNTALADFSECLRLDNFYSQAYRLRANAYEHLGEDEKALSDYNIYLHLVPADTEALFSRAVLRFEADLYDLARKDFYDLLFLPKSETNTVFFGQEKFNDSNARIFTAHSAGKDHIFNYLGLIDTNLKSYTQAIVWFDSAIRISNQNPAYWINRGSAKLKSQDSPGALNDFNAALKLDPDNSLAIHNIATIRSAEGESSTSEKLLTQAIEKNNALPYPRAERAYQRLQRNDLAGALEDYNEVVRMEPKDGENYLNRGLVKEKLKDLKGALADYSKAIELDDTNEKSWVSHGNVLSKLHRWNEAIEDYSIAISLASDYGLAYYNQAIAYQSTGKLDEACNDLKKAESLGVKANARMKERVCR